MAAAGCGYSFSGSNLPSHIKTVAIPNFENSTLEPRVAEEATTAVIDGFVKDGRLKLAPEGQADSRLAGVVTSYENRVHNYAADQTPQDYVVVLTMSLGLRDQVKNRELWADAALTRTAVWVPGATAGPASEEEARLEALRLAATEIVTRTLEQW